jgi:hypothetical protein
MSDKARTGREADANAFERGARAVSDGMDRILGQGITRDVVHGVYHGGAGVARGVSGNFGGARAEFNRSGQHFSNGRKKFLD